MHNSNNRKRKTKVASYIGKFVPAVFKSGKDQNNEIKNPRDDAVIRKAFNTMDTDNSYTLSVTELKVAMEKCNVFPT